MGLGIRSTAVCTFSFLASIWLLIAPAFAQQPKVLAPHRPIPERVNQKIDWSKKATPRSMVGGLWMVDANFKSSIYLRSVIETDPITVTPILWLANGNKYVLSPVTLDPAGIAIIDINAGLASQGISSWATLSGYVELDYNWPWDPFCATIRDVDVAHSLIFTYGLRPSTPLNPHMDSALPGPQTVQGMWWKDTPEVTGFVALANISSQPVQATLQLNDHLAQNPTQHTITVSPHGTKKVNLEELGQTTDSSGGLSITYNGPAEALVVNGGVENEGVGYSADLPFASRPLQESELPPYAKLADLTSIAELGLMVGAADPMMNFPANTTFKPYSVLRNISGSPVTVTPTIWWMQGGTAHSAQLQPLQLQAQETRNLDVMSMLSLAGLQNFNGSFNLVFDGDLKQGSLIPAAGSVDQTKTYVFEVAPHGVAESASKSLQYWSTGNGDDTMITLWNPADEAQDLIFKLFFSGGHYLVPIHLDPRATRSINMSEITQNSIPDAEGNIIPPSIHQGSGKITGSHADNENILVAIDAGIYNVRKATCGGSCLNCDGYSNWEVQLNPFGVGINAQYTVTLSAAYDGGSRYNFAGTWSSSNTSVMTVASSTGTTTGVSVGSATVGGPVANLQSAPVYAPQCNPYGSCPVAYGGGGSSNGSADDPTPVINSISNQPWPAGTTTSFTISGSGFGTNPSLGISGTGIDDYGISDSSDSQIDGYVTVDPSAPNESVAVTVTSNGYNGSGFVGNPGQSNKASGSAAVTAQSGPTVSISINFTGTKSSGDNLSFENGVSYECSESLGLHSCSTAWLWNIEGKGTASDDASKWTVKQSYTGRRKGYYKDSSGVLHSFNDPLSVSDDGPDSGFVQQPSGQKAIYWIDGPGFFHNYINGSPIDSVTQVQDFTTTFCSTVSQNDCKSINWYLKVVVKPGAQLDTTNTKAALGALSTNF